MLGGDSTSNPFRPKGAESYEDQLDDDETPFVQPPATAASAARAQEEEEEIAFIPVSQHTQQQQEQLGGAMTTPATATSKSSPPATSYGSAAGESGLKSNFFFFLSFLSVDYYRPYFDVSTRAVVQRIKNSMDVRQNDVFALPANQPQQHEPLGQDAEAQAPPPAPAPEAAVAEFDLYGSVWISFTLIFLIGATSNFNALLADAGGSKKVSTDYTLLTLAGTMVLVYSSIFPALVWLAAGWFGAANKPTLFKTMALFGYIQSSFCLASVLCVVPNAIVQWLAVVLAALVSGVVLVRNLRAQITFEDEQQQAEGRMPHKQRLLLGAVLLGHAAFAILLKLFFFQGADV